MNINETLKYLLRFSRKPNTIIIFLLNSWPNLHYGNISAEFLAKQMKYKKILKNTMKFPAKPEEHQETLDFERMAS